MTPFSEGHWIPRALKLTLIAPEQMVSQKKKIIFQLPTHQFSGAMSVSFREADTPLQNSTAGSTENTLPKTKRKRNLTSRKPTFTNSRVPPGRFFQFLLVKKNDLNLYSSMLWITFVFARTARITPHLWSPSSSANRVPGSHVGPLLMRLSSPMVIWLVVFSQPLWKNMQTSNWKSFPEGSGVKIKNDWNHHLVMELFVLKLCVFFGCFCSDTTSDNFRSASFGMLS